MNKKKNVISLICMSALLALCGCSGTSDINKNTPSDGLEKLGTISVISREDGSGTRASFAALLEFEEDNPNSDKSDKTSNNAVIANDTEEVVYEVKNDIGAIG